ncbi:LAME_0H02718g1_1 [Lachancea meyersii CBS 8951]|uniref:non-specific serine/threonine protein kinase n=1 Tax=Lachancea meyersii CBS 8951 TaxID=1266667 RepID=A0A1G4KDV1_9SACH|nr:LAME_0H02718g1_1 [Lachancea meyersii CBS 8951]
MPNLLGRSVFHHSKGLHGAAHDPSSHSDTNVRSSRSFLGFMNHTSSRESVGSDSGNESRGNIKRSGGSMNELKRFFRPAILHRKPSQNNLRNGSPDHHSHTQSAIPPSSDSTLSLSNRVNIYHDDSILAQKYGKLGKVLGSGAGGSVRVITRPSDGATFAVKEFRPRRPNELVKDYAKKCTAEFCIGSTLHHPNIIETLDIFSDAKQNKYYEVMEYCPIDFFAVVMSGQMTRGEINCCLRQLTEGVKYLHEMGLAHRDLKLDNCVMSTEGLLKLIDFGSAVVYKYPFDSNITMAHGIVGSDPYLAPEVMTSTKRYDPQCVDVWSIGIIYCCMMLKRFPWKTPKDTDENFRLFCLPDDVEHDYVKSAQEHEKLMKQRRQEKHRSRKLKEEADENSTCAERALPSQAPENASSRCQNENGGHQIEEGVGKIDDSKATPKNEREALGEKQGGSQTVKDHESQAERTTMKGEQTVEQNDEPRASTHDASQAGIEERQLPSKAYAHDAADPRPSSPVPQLHQQKHRSREHGRSKRVMNGPYRLLRLLPHASRPIMSRILTIDPKERATMQEIYQDPWFSTIPYCTNDLKKVVRHAAGHTHTVVCEEDAHLEHYEGKP